MNERELQLTIRQMLLTGFASQNMPVRVQRNYQQRSTGTPDVPTIVYHRIATAPSGWQYRKHERLDKTAPNGDPYFVAKETHLSNEVITFQFNAIVKDPAPDDESITDVTASDLLLKARMIFVAERTRLKSLGVNILHITTVADVMVQNESDNWEEQPSFDLQFAVKQELSREVGAATQLTGSIQRV